MPHFDRPVLMWVTDRKHSDAPLPELAADIYRQRERSSYSFVNQGSTDSPAELLARAILAVCRPLDRAGDQFRYRARAKSSALEFTCLKLGRRLPRRARSWDPRRWSDDRCIRPRAAAASERSKLSGGWTCLRDRFETGPRPTGARRSRSDRPSDLPALCWRLEASPRSACRRSWARRRRSRGDEPTYQDLRPQKTLSMLTAAHWSNP